MKSEFVLGVNAQILKDIGLKQGVNMIHIDQLAPLIQGDIIIGQREALEKDASKRHMIPYGLLTVPEPVTDLTKFFTYRRGKGVGESRLAGNVSIGIGGHIDFVDVAHENSVIDVSKTVMHSFARELQEEVIFGGVSSEIGINSVGCLIDDSNPVGEVHLGLIMTCALEAGCTVQCAEEELETLGFFTAQELLDSGLPLENWTKIICQFFVDNGL